MFVQWFEPAVWFAGTGREGGRARYTCESFEAGSAKRLVKDEPKASDFALLKNWTAELAITHPGKLRFINLLPNCSAMGTPVMSNASYTEYVHRFAQEVQPDLLAFDIYPEFKEQASLVAYRRTLALFRSLALAHRIPVRRFSSYSHFLW